MKVTPYQISMGCDPELFLMRGGKVIGSEKAVPKKGLGNENQPSVIRDGVQVEFNPMAATCRQSLAWTLQTCFNLLKDSLPRGVKPSFAVTVDVTKEEMASLAPENQKLGCNASFNIYDPEATVNAKSTYLKRSAGGHIHLGFIRGYGDAKTPVEVALKQPEILVPVLDAIVGNTMVLIDRDKGNIERRKHYGRAGEYRTPAHGLEYRTLSNFWLQHYVLMSFAMGLARQAVQLVASDREDNQVVSEFMKRVDVDSIRRAINNNDAALAARNFERMAPVLCKLFPSTSFSLNKTNIGKFRHFVAKPIDYWLPERGIKTWTASNVTATGWELFLDNNVRLDMEKAPVVENKRFKITDLVPKFSFV